MQARALDLVKIRSTPMQAKIRELYKASQESQQAAMMNQGPGQPHLNYNAANMHYMNMITGAGVNPYGSNAAAAAAALSLQGRNPYATGAAGGYAGLASATNSLYGTYGMQQQQSAATVAAAAASQHATLAMAPRNVPTHPDLKFVKLPFYDIHAELLRPTTLPSHGNSRFHEAQFQFFLTPQQATDIASNRDISVTPQPEYIHQVGY